MDYVRKIVEACRNNYEKLILIGVLILLAVVVVVLSAVRSQEAAKIEEFLKGMDRRASKPMAPLDYTSYQTALTEAQNPSKVDFSLPHHLFNPVIWQLRPDGTKMKIQTGTEVGPAVLTITKLTELNAAVFLDRVSSQGAYYIGYSNAATADRRMAPPKRQKFVTLNASNEVCILREIKGDPENPTELVLELSDTREKVTISKDQAHVRVVGYEANLKYPVEGKTFNKLREGDEIRFDGESYKIVDITAREVVVSAASNNKEYRVTRMEPQ